MDIENAKDEANESWIILSAICKQTSIAAKCNCQIWQKMSVSSVWKLFRWERNWTLEKSGKKDKIEPESMSINQ